MGIHPTDAKRTDSSIQRSLILPFPGTSLRRDIKRTVLQVERRIGLAEVQTRRQDMVLHRQHGLDDARHPRRDIQMPDIRFDRTKSAIPLFLGLLAKNLSQSSDLN